MQKNIIIGFAGRALTPSGKYAGNACVGKDSAASCLQRFLVKDRPVFIRNLADTIKETVLAKFGLNWNAFHRENKEIPIVTLGKKTYSPRDLAQLEGTEYGRNVYGEDVWIKSLESHVSNITQKRSIIIVADIRFKNEADWVRKNGLLVHVTRERKDELPDDYKFHDSEKEITINQKHDIILNNNGTLDDLLFLVKDNVLPYVDNLFPPPKDAIMTNGVSNSENICI